MEYSFFRGICVIEIEPAMSVLVWSVKVVFLQLCMLQGDVQSKV